jgi:hypothetical protein
MSRAPAPLWHVDGASSGDEIALSFFDMGPQNYPRPKQGESSAFTRLVDLLLSVSRKDIDARLLRNKEGYRKPAIGSTSRKLRPSETGPDPESETE